VPLAALLPQLEAEGYAVLDAKTVAQWAQHPLSELTALVPDWEGMPEDAYLKDGGHYRLRRHSCFTFENNQLVLAPARAHWQSLSYNALHGGMQRWFEPMHTHTGHLSFVPNCQTSPHDTCRNMLNAFGFQAPASKLSLPRQSIGVCVCAFSLHLFSRWQWGR
jgi:hypothetical protein